MSENNAKITYYNGPKEYGKCQEGFENHMSTKDVEKLEEMTDKYVANVNKLLGEREETTSKITLDFIIKFTDPKLK